MKRQYHGSRGVVSQMVRNMSTLQNLKRHAQHFNRGKCKTYVSRMLHGTSPEMTALIDGTFVFGQVSKENLQVELPDAILRWIQNNDIQYWSRMKAKSHIFHSLYTTKGGVLVAATFLNSIAMDITCLEKLWFFLHVVMLDIVS